ncbi:Nucleotidylyl transferase [Tolypocladium paradoxum]|uniref:Nucleotidylyl transferase n=1 Tax=Tolypocladium paradoxum TaxID=94208 RepID=A0A2S4L1W3_9HYPO|nr:Nucleotidylyl transferase [Tolypocladium paradoxum]
MTEAQPSPSMRPNPKQLIDFFSRSLASFDTSHDALRILCTLPRRSDSPAPRPPTRSVRRLVVLDSSFNPPTRAHAQMARSAVRDAGSGDGDGGGAEEAARLLLMLAVNNADKAPRPASFALRLAMMEGFARELGEGMEVDVAVTRMPFFHDKARAISESGVYGAPEQVFLVGFDTLVRIFNPKYYNAAKLGEAASSSPEQHQQTPMQAALGPFFARARLRVTTRPGDAWGTQEEQRAYVRGLGDGVLDDVGGRREWARRVDVVDGGEMGGVSSSRVRDVVRTGGLDGLDGMVDEEVRAWIEREGLYRE